MYRSFAALRTTTRQTPVILNKAKDLCVSTFDYIVQSVRFAARARVLRLNQWRKTRGQASRQRLAYPRNSAPNSLSAFSTFSMVPLISSSVRVRSGARSVML